jgi:hypothetical protein
MRDERRRERRSPLVVILDASLGLAAAVQTGHPPWSRRARRQSRRTGAGWLAVGAMTAAAGTAILVAAFVRPPDDLAALPPAAVEQTPPRSPGRSPIAVPGPAGTISPSPAASRAAPGGGAPVPDRREAARPPGPVAPLTARYSVAEGTEGLLGYRATVTVTNPGTRARPTWLVTVTLPRPTLRVAEVSGAVAEQDGATWSFRPDRSTAPVPAGGSVRVTFEVRGATLVSAAPTACTIDANSCAGIRP